VGAGRHFVIEGDEYDSAYFDKTAKFLKYLPEIAIVNNVEFDHADIYRDLDAVRLAFRRLTTLVPRNGCLLLGADSPDAWRCRARRSARWRPSVWRGRHVAGHDVVHRDGLTHFDVQPRADRSAGSRRRSSARTTCATRWPASRWAPRPG
jgi:UDP-N-acetylmuramate-alanine ligase